MPSKEEHLAQAHHNEQFYGSFDRRTYKDWAVTVLFYVGLHYIDAFLATKNIHPWQHDVREGCVKKLQELRTLYHDYRFMKNHSRTARYHPPTEFSMSDITNLETVHLARIKSMVQQHL